MADPLADSDELVKVNEEREAAGLQPFQAVEEARQWKTKQATAGEAPKADPAPAQAETPKDEAATSVPFPTAPKKADVPATDGKVAELEREVQRLKSERGRWDKLTSEHDELKAQLAEATKRAAEAEARAEEAVTKARGDGLLSFLTEEEQAAIDPKAFSAIERYVRSVVGKTEQAVTAKLSEADRRIAEREARDQQYAKQAQQQRIGAMWEQVAKAIPPTVYGKLPSTPKWEEWCNKTFAGRTYGELYTEAVNNADSEAVEDLLSKAIRYAGIEIPNKGAQPPLKPTESRGSSQVQTPTEDVFYELDAQKVEDDYTIRRTLPSGWTQNQMDRWLNKLDDARREGRVRPGRAPR